MSNHSMPSLAGILLAVVVCTFGCGHDTSPAVSLLGPDASSDAVRDGIAETALITPVFDPAKFVVGVNHPFFPLVPGTTMRYAGETDQGLETNDVEVLPETKVILGVTATVVSDRVYLDGVLTEDTRDWYAQDQDGNVWYLGEDSKSYADGTVSSEGSWEAGVNDAEAGIVMEAHPRVGDRYRQEFAPGSAEDMASVKSLTKSVTVPYGTFDSCIQTMEFSPLAHGDRGYKFYAKGLGLVLEVAPRGGQERSELVAIVVP